MSQDLPTPTGASPTRRTLLAGTVGLAGAAFLAACSSDAPKPGVSGATVPSTSTPPTVPVTEPSQLALDEDKNQLQTAQSLELLAAKVYTDLGPKLTDADLKAAASRFADEHTAAAAVFGAATTETKASSQPNEYLMTNVVDPYDGQLNTDTGILAFLANIESALVATYIAATGLFTSADWRQKIMTYGAASANRNTVLSNGGKGQAPREPLYPATDLIPGDAFVGAEPKAAG